jgi:hypothetical protein
MRQPRLLLLALPALAVVAGSVMTSPAARGASGEVVHPAAGASWALRSAPAAATVSNVIYHGGPVMAGEMQVYAIFWEPGGSFVSPKFNMLLKRYFRDVGGSGLYANNGQYTDSSGQAPTGAELAGTFVDRSPYPATPVLQDSDIRNEVTHAMSVKGWQPGITHVFFVYTAANESICFALLGLCSPPLGSMCGYHFGFPTPGGVVLYAGMPYAGNSLARCYGLTTSPNKDIAADAEVNSPRMSRWRRPPTPRPAAGSAQEASPMKSATNAPASSAQSTLKGQTSTSKDTPTYCKKSGITRFLAARSPGHSQPCWFHRPPFNAA